MSVVTSTAIAIAVGAGASAAGTIVSSKMQSNAANRAAKLRTDAETEIARLTSGTADRQLNFQQEEARRLRGDTYNTQRLNYDQWAAGQRNDAGRFNIGSKLESDMANAASSNQRGEFNAQRGDVNTRYATRAGDMSNIRAMVGGPGWAPATFAPIDPLERVQADVYTPEDPGYVGPAYVPPVLT